MHQLQPTVQVERRQSHAASGLPTTASATTLGTHTRREPSQTRQTLNHQARVAASSSSSSSSLLMRSPPSPSPSALYSSDAHHTVSTSSPLSIQPQQQQQQQQQQHSQPSAPLLSQRLHQPHERHENEKRHDQHQLRRAEQEQGRTSRNTSATTIPTMRSTNSNTDPNMSSRSLSNRAAGLDSASGSDAGLGSAACSVTTEFAETSSGRQITDIKDPRSSDGNSQSNGANSSNSNGDSDTNINDNGNINGSSKGAITGASARTPTTQTSGSGHCNRHGRIGTTAGIRGASRVQTSSSSSSQRSHSSSHTSSSTTRPTSSSPSVTTPEILSTTTASSPPTIQEYPMHSTIDPHREHPHLEQQHHHHSQSTPVTTKSHNSSVTSASASTSTTATVSTPLSSDIESTDILEPNPLATESGDTQSPNHNGTKVMSDPGQGQSQRQGGREGQGRQAQNPHPRPHPHPSPHLHTPYSGNPPPFPPPGATVYSPILPPTGIGMATLDPHRQPPYPQNPAAIRPPQLINTLHHQPILSPFHPSVAPPPPLQPFMTHGYGYEYHPPGYYPPGGGWNQRPPISLQKKPKDLDKAMWVGNVLNDTTVEELQAIFEAPPTEEEGDVIHDVPESIFILNKSNCAFVNYASHEAVDRAVLRFHDKEFKNTRLVCRPRKEPVAIDSYGSFKSSSGHGRSPQHFYSIHQHQAHYPEHIPYLHDGGHRNQHNPASLEPNAESHGAHNSLSEVQVRMDRMRLDASPLREGSPSWSEGRPMTLAHLKHKDPTNLKKSRSSSSLGYTDSRYFVLKGLNEEDLKLSVQYGLWATQDHLVPILNDAFNNTKDVYLVFSVNKSGEFFGYGRMMDLISKEWEEEKTKSDPNTQWRPVADIPLSPELKASMLQEVEAAEKEGKPLSELEAEQIALASTTTKSWGTKFPIRWLHVRKVPFSKTSHLFNPYYENREIKLSKDGTEVESSVGEQLVALFQKSKSTKQDQESSGDTESPAHSETHRHKHSSSTEHGTPTHLMPHQNDQIEGEGEGGGGGLSSRRSSILSSQSAGSGSGSGTGRERRGSDDAGQRQGEALRSGYASPPHSQQRSRLNDQQATHHNGGQRSHSRHRVDNAEGNALGEHAPQQAPYSHEASLDSYRGRHAKSKYKGGHGTLAMAGPPGFDSVDNSFLQTRPQEHSFSHHHNEQSPHPKRGGKYSKYSYGQPHYSNNMHNYDQGSSPSRHTYQKRHVGGGQQQPSGSHRSGPGSFGGMNPMDGSGFRRQPGGPPIPGRPARLPGPYEYAAVPSPGAGAMNSGFMPMMPRPSRHGGPLHAQQVGAMYPGQGPLIGYPGMPHASHGVMPGYVMPPYMGYPFGPMSGQGPSLGPGTGGPASGPGIRPGPPGLGLVPHPYMHGTAPWYPAGVNMMPGAVIPVMPGATAAGPGGGIEDASNEGLIPLVGPDGISYGHMSPEEAYRHHQQMYEYGVMSNEESPRAMDDTIGKNLTSQETPGDERTHGNTTENLGGSDETHDERATNVKEAEHTDKPGSKTRERDDKENKP
ncbi:hypothetical protein BGZ94_005634 [Podila epigama]|nr:hypothetical protein BGZ94_005634 [Podila epigama]